MSLADKYIVEAKTLFEYKQYLLGTDALARSDAQFFQISRHLFAAKQNGKDSTLLRDKMLEESIVHERLLTRLMVDVPETFVWEPENAKSSTLSLYTLLKSSIDIRLQEASRAMQL